MKTILAIDKGTTNIKAVLFDLKGQQLESASRSCEMLSTDKPGWTEQDMYSNWDLTKSVIKDVVNKGYEPENIVSIGVSGMGNGLYMIDANGDPVRNAIMSIDTRATGLIKQMVEEGIDAKLKKITQFGLYGGSATILLRWLKENESKSYHKIRWILYCKDWINYKLTGNISTDLTDASGGALTGIRTGEYAREIFDYLGIEECRDKLPPIIPTAELCGHITEAAAAETGLKEGTPVVSGAHDIAASVWGAGGMDQGHLTIVVGTCGLNLVVLDEVKPTYNAVLSHVIPNRWLAVNGDNNSGSSLDWFVNHLCAEEKMAARAKGVSVYQVIEEKIRGQNSGGIIFHPFLYGSIDNGSALSGLFGMSGWHSKANILRAVYEGIAFSHRHCVDKLRTMTTLKEAVLVGGGAKSNVWGQIFADIMGIPIKTLDEEEITARGVALCAGIGAGIFKDYQDAHRTIPVKNEYIPDPVAQSRYSEQYALFNDLIENMIPIWDRSHKISSKP